jgi:hypothetical protein
VSNKPDPVVREPEARASVDELTKGLVADAERAGVLPPMREIERVARQVTHETIARHEDQFRNGVPDQQPKPTPSGAGPARLDQGSFTDELGDASIIRRPFDAERWRVKTKAVSLADAIESMRVRERLGALTSFEKGPDGRPRERFPEWAARLRKAYTETLALSKNLGIPHKEAESNAADAVLKVLDESSATFGDWRHPKGEASRPLIFTGSI